MQQEDRIVHFSAELIHGPVELSKEALQRFYFDLSQQRNAGYDSTDFSNPAQARFYSNRGKKTQSMLLFLPDRAVFIEEWTDLSVRDFMERVRDIGGRILEARGADKYLAHTVTIRSTFALTHFEDARVFLMDYACNQDGRIAPHFQRPVATGGLRFVLPETNEHPGVLHIAIESFRYSRNEVFAEVKGIFGQQQVSAENMGAVVENIRVVRSFLSDHIFPYLNQFDVPKDPENEGA